MKVKEGIIITDPCYLINNDLDWNISDNGSDLESLGFYNYINEENNIGDWSCETYKIEEDPKKYINKIANTLALLPEEDSVLGKFTSDSGQVAVVTIKEALKYNPKIMDWIEKHHWCATVLKDFKGEIEFYIDRNDEAHILGIGNYNFITVQIGF